MASRKSWEQMEKLGDLQLKILDALWRVGQGTVYEVLEALPEADRRNYMTIATVLRNLEKRGLVTHTTRERSFVFRPVSSREEVRAGLVRSLLTRAFGGRPQHLVSSLLEAEEMTPEELAELRALIAAKEQELNQEG